jgi:hypothetical protein
MKYVITVLIAISSIFNANAIDASKATAPSKIEDKKITIGDRELILPEGDWTLIAVRETAVIRSGISRVGTTYNTYAVKIVDQKWVAAVLFRANEYSVSGIRSWIPEPCKADTIIFKDEYAGRFDFPECLMVQSRGSHLRNSTGEFFPQAEKWLKSNDITLPGSVYQITYSKYQGGDYGLVTVFLPKNNKTSDESVVDWSKTLQPKLEKMLGKHESQAQVPELPAWK